MTNLNNIVFYDNLPKLDLHGFDVDTARVYVNDFIKDNIKMKNEVILIIHGNGSGALRNAVNQTLRKNKSVIEFKQVLGNTGSTVVRISFDR